MEALSPRFMNSTRLFALVELNITRLPRTCALRATTIPSPSRELNTIFRLSVHFIFFFFSITSSSSLDGWREGIFSVSLWNSGMAILQDPRILCP